MIELVFGGVCSGFILQFAHEIETTMRKEKINIKNREVATTHRVAEMKIASFENEKNTPTSSPPHYHQHSFVLCDIKGVNFQKKTSVPFLSRVCCKKISEFSQNIRISTLLQIFEFFQMCDITNPLFYRILVLP